VFLPDDACYECGMTGADYAHLNLRYSCPGLRRTDLEEGKTPTTPTISSIIAGLQVQEALKLLHGMGPERSTAIMFNGTTNLLYTSVLPAKEDCLSHERYSEPVPLPLGAGTSSAADLMASLADTLEGPLALELDRDLLEAFDCPGCSQREEVFLPVSSVGDGRLACPLCGTERIPSIVHRIEEGSALAERTLASLGVPPYHIVRVTSVSGEVFALLCADRGG
jgi:adenylyltransferase/sulfurtransferase